MKSFLLKIFLIFCIFSIATAGFYTKKTYKAPERNSLYIKVEIAIFDNNQEILEVKLNKKKLSLKPKDPQKNRGNIFLKLTPGTYTIKWTTKNQKYIWPRTLNHKKTFKIKKEDNWIHIRIEGSKIFIT